jgi:small subunit ribosomal protein S5
MTDDKKKGKESSKKPEKEEEVKAADADESGDAEFIEKAPKIIEIGDAEEVEVVKRDDIKKEEEIVKEKKEVGFDSSGWEPKTEVGRKVKNGEITDIDQILDRGNQIMETEIVDILLPNCETELLMIGQSKGKFGGGQRRIFKQTQKKTKEGNKPKFATFAVHGNMDGYVGYGYGKAKETVPAREKAFRKAKLNVMKIRRGCGSWECSCGQHHSIPFKVKGKVSSVELTLIPAPKGTGLCIEPECQKILRLAGIKDVWSKSLGHTKTKLNLIKACIKAVENLSATKVLPVHVKALSIKEGRAEN